MNDIIDIRARFRESFFDRSEVIQRIGRAKAKGLSRAGAYVRRRAQSSIRRPRRCLLSELSPERQGIFAQQQRTADRNGTPQPLLPYAASRPGEPPRTPTGKLPKTILFALDQAEDAVVIGPVLTSGSSVRVPSTLEFGGRETIFGTSVTIEPRPFMQPALEAELHRIPSFFESTL
ncbi:MAG: hypothetical protein U0941_30030 [Planctomycetaceae bacterium]